MGTRSGGVRIDICLNDHQATARLDHPTLCNQEITLGRGQKMDFHLAGQHFLFWRHDAQGGIACCAVPNGKGQARMPKSVLLAAAGQDGGLDPGFARCHHDEARAQCGHHCLRRKTGMNPLLDPGG